MLVIFSACSNDDAGQNIDQQEKTENQSQATDDQSETAGTDSEDVESKPVVSQTEEVESQPTSIHERPFETIAVGLDEPWEIVSYQDSLYVSERPGAIVTIKDDNQTRKPVQFAKDLASQPEAGLLGIALPKDFSETKEAFAYYSYQEGDDHYQRVVTIKENKDNWEEQKVLLDKIPGGKYHQGGRIEIGPDNKLYITTGDAASPALAQDLNSLAGKVLRMNLDGTVPEDNPFEDSYVYTYGHRNPQGLAWDDEGNLYATEHGDNAHDEMNMLQKGHNYGWPLIIGIESASDMETPLVQSGQKTWAPAGMTYLDGEFYFASLRGKGVRVYNPADNSVHMAVSDVGRVRDTLATDEGIYLITNNTDGRGDPSKKDDRLLFIPITKS